MNQDLEKDDEITRIVAMTGGPEMVGMIKIRPTAALEVSWMQRAGILDPKMDILWRACAFMVIHTADKAKLRATINHADKFAAMVDDWMESANPGPIAIQDYSNAMNTRLQEWFASASSDGKSGDSPGN